MMVTIRPFTESDRAAAVDLFHELNRHEAEISGDRKTDRAAAEICVTEMQADAATRPGVSVVVAEVDGQVAGLMVFAEHLDDSFIEAHLRRSGRVEDIVVAEAFRGQGIGRALLAEAERLARQGGMKRLRLTVLSGNDGALSAYGRFGFRDYASVMVKDLD